MCCSCGKETAPFFFFFLWRDDDERLLFFFFSSLFFFFGTDNKEGMAWYGMQGELSSLFFFFFFLSPLQMHCIEREGVGSFFCRADGKLQNLVQTLDRERGVPACLPTLPYLTCLPYLFLTGTA